MQTMDDEGAAPALRLTGVRKVFADNVAVNDIDLVVPRVGNCWVLVLGKWA